LAKYVTVSNTAMFGFILTALLTQIRSYRACCE